MMTLAIILGLVAIGLYTWGITKLVAEKKNAGWILVGATAVLLFLFIPTITPMISETGERASQDTEQVTAAEEDTTQEASDTKYVEGIGDLTLIKGIYPDDALSIDPLGVAISGIKVFRVDNPEASLKSDIERQTGEPVGDSFYYMTVGFTAVSMVDQEIEWFGLASVTLDDGTWLNQEDDDMFLGQDSDGNEITPYYNGTQMKEYMQMYVIDNPDINSVELEFDQTSDAYSSETISPSKTVTYEFE